MKKIIIHCDTNVHVHICVYLVSKQDNTVEMLVASSMFVCNRPTTRGVQKTQKCQSNITQSVRK